MGQQSQSNSREGQRLNADSGRLKKAASQATSSRGKLDTSVQATQSLQRNNQASLQKAGSVRTEAQKEGVVLDGMAQEKRAKKSALGEQLRMWALAHQQARLAKMQASSGKQR